MIDKIAIVYQDDSIIAVNKPPFLSVFPKESKHEKDSLFGILKKQISSKIFPVHSIDKDASGIIIFAKNEKARLFLISQFKDSLIKREFIVLLSGVLEN
ncbi:MAG: RluA family pseudouridine synthase, partial [Elusimicrobiota bacterium]|nr:RluA family pseudouridine synthase [Elusimicrobiota bacterium]